MKVRVNVMGRAASSSLPAELELISGATVADALASLRALSGDSRWHESTLVAVSGRHAGTLGKHVPLPLQENDELLLLVPVAGG